MWFADKYRDVKDYFIKLRKRPLEHWKKLGYPLCPNNHVTSIMM
jgi:CBS domain-containing protein